MKRNKIPTKTRIREAIHFRLNQAGEIKTDDAWQIIRLSPPGRHVAYSTIVTGFRNFMNEMVSDGLATKIRKGVWNIHKSDTFK